jgi:N-acetylglucosamine-6-phosphate deacetylase
MPQQETLSGHLVLPDRILPGLLHMTDGRISAIEPRSDVPDRFVLPGFIDIHVHGGNGADAMDGEADVERMARFHLQCGVTTILPTTMTRPWNEVLAALHAIRNVARRGIADGPDIPGAHLEGPFISPNRLGAQPPYAVSPTSAEIEAITALDIVRLTTLAPERCSTEAITALAKAGVRISIGHTDATAEDCARLFQIVQAANGTVGGTHLFNAMPEIRGRAPGPVAALLADDHAFVELIFDTHHVHPTAFALMRKAAPGRVILISDAMRAAGCGDGLSSLGGLPVLVRDGIARMGEDGSGGLAGSILTLDQALRNALDHGVPLIDASAMLSGHPARYLGLTDRGALREGLRADAVVVDARHQVEEVWRSGIRLR